MEITVSNNLLKQIQEAFSKDKIDKIVVGAVIVFDFNEILLIRRIANDFMGGLVELPSGKVDNQENLLQALYREVLEETNLEIAYVDDFIGSFDYKSSSGKKTRQLNFKVRTKNTEVKLNKNEHDKYFIISINSIETSELNISEETRQIIINSVFNKK